MSTIDPYPPELEIEAPTIPRPTPPPQPPVDAHVAALNRIAVALEQLTLAVLDRPQPIQNAPGAALAALPPVQPVAQPVAATADVCPIHGTPWKVVPAGVSKKTGRAYEAFKACSTAGCDQRPRL